MGSHILSRCIPHSVRWAPHQASSPINLNSCTSPSPHSDGLYLLVIPTRQSHPLYRNQGIPHHLVTTKPASQSPCWFTLILSATPLWPCVLFNVLLPLGYRYMSPINRDQSHLSSGGCCVFGHLLPRRVGNSSYTNMTNKK